MSESDTHILNGSPVEITFAGETYRFKEKPRRKQRQVREDLCEIAAIMGEIEETESQSRKMPLILRAVNAILGFCEDHHPEMARDIESIELHVRSGGVEGMTQLITDVFTPLFKAWVEPYIPTVGSSEKKMTTTT